MQVRSLAVLVLLSLFIHCYPDDPCGGQFVFDDVNALCFECPKGSSRNHGTCECMDGYFFDGRRCQLMDGAVPSVPDGGGDMSDASDDAYASDGCKNYCSFATTCLGGNSLAMGALPDVVMGLHADNASACENSCKADVGSDEAKDPAISCIVGGQEAAMCGVPNPQQGLENAFGLIGQCCAPNASNKLCKSICKTLKASPLTANDSPFCD